MITFSGNVTRVVLVRHGQTDWNRDQIFRGRVDVPLNETGRAEARKIGEALRGIPLDAVYSSPLSRAVETARAILVHHSLELRTDPGLMDIDYGRWQGVALNEVKRMYPDLYRAWSETPESVQMPGGESLEDVRRRTMEALKRICRTHPGGTVLIVAHRVVNKVLLCAVMGLDNRHFWAIKQDNCALNVFDYGNGSYVLHLLNDTCHLKSVGAKWAVVDF